MAQLGDGAAAPSPVRVDDLQRLRQLVERDFGSSLSDVERRWLDDACLARYLRARKLRVDRAHAMLSETLRWRREFNVLGLVSNELPMLSRESATGKLYTRGHDKFGRSVVYMKPRLQNTKDNVANLRQLVYTLERATAQVIPPQEKLTLLLDFKGYSIRTAPSMRVSRETLHILQNHYPERLGLAVCVDAPSLFFGFFRVIKPFVDPVTARKIVFVERGRGGAFAPDSKGYRFMCSTFNMNELEKDYGGENARPFNVDEYFLEQWRPLWLP